MLRSVPQHEPSNEGPFQNALLIVSPTRCVSALQAELPTNVPTLVELKSMNGLAKVAVWPSVTA